MIITTIEQIRAILPNVAAEVAFSDFEPHVQSAENWISNDLLGEVLYVGIEDGSLVDEKLLRLSKNCIILKAYELGIPFMDLVQTQNGFGVIQDKNRAPASKQRVDRLIAQNTLRLNQEIEWLMNYLEDTPTYHNDWKSSAAYSLLSDCLITTAREFKRLVRFEGSREDFLMLKPTLVSLTTLKLQPLVSRAYVSELLEKQVGGTLSVYDKTILLGVKQALANFAIGEESLGKRLLEDAINIMDNDLDHYPTYRDSWEKQLRDDPGHVNTLEDPIFVFKAGM